MWLQVLVQAREDLIERTIESLVGAKKVIIHMYNSTSPAQRRVVFGKSKAEIVEVAVRENQQVKEGDLLFRIDPEPYRIAIAQADASIAAAQRFGEQFRGDPRTGPVLTQAAERLGSGDYDTPMRGLDRSDEIGQLAQSFESMRVSVAEQQAQNLRLAYWDALTGLPNRVQFREAVAEAIAAAPQGGSVAVLMLDLDRFKHVNDVLGYDHGDQIGRAHV